MPHTSMKQFGTLLLALLQALCEGVDDGGSVHLILFPLTLQQPDLIQQPLACLRLTNTHTVKPQVCTALCCKGLIRTLE